MTLADCNIMQKQSLPNMTRATKLLLATCGLATILVPFVAGIVQAPLKFEVATIRPTKSEGQRGGMEILPGGGLRMEGATLMNLIALAYGIREEKISGGAKWMNSDTYVISAKADIP